MCVVATYVIMHVIVTLVCANAMVVVATYVSGCLIWLCNHVLISVYIYVVVLYAIPSHNTHVLLAATVCVIIGLRTHF